MTRKPRESHMSETNNHETKTKKLFGDINNSTKNDNPAIPAATIILLREKEERVQVLMLQKNAEITFGGMWVFPGGRVDESDYAGKEDVDLAARNAAVRETEEETGLKLNGDNFVYFSHWTPPKSAPKRYATWFFAAEANGEEDIEVDGEEILSHRWICPKEAIELQKENKIELAPPTWVTLYHLSQRNSITEILENFSTSSTKIYKTRVARDNDGIPIILWYGDAAYESLDLGAEGHRHRLAMGKNGFGFENTVEEY